MSGRGDGQEAKITAVNANHIGMLARASARAAPSIQCRRRPRLPPDPPVDQYFRQRTGWHIFIVIRGRFVAHNDHNPDRIANGRNISCVVSAVDDFTPHNDTLENDYSFSEVL